MSRLPSSILLLSIFLLLSERSLRSDEPAVQPNPLPAGALTRFGTPRFLNLGRVFSIAFAPDEKTLASGSWDGTVRIWEIATGKELHLFSERKTPIRTVAFSPDGKLLAYAGEDVGIVLRDTATGKELHRLKDHRGPITVIAFSPDGKLLASKGYDHTLRLWDVTGGREVRRLSSTNAPKEANDPECPPSFALDGKTLISATLLLGNFTSQEQRTLRVWDVASGAEVRSFKDSGPSPGMIAFSPDNKLMAVAIGKGRVQPPRINIWDVVTGKALRPIEGVQAEHPQTLFTLAFSPDGKTLASSLGGPIALWEVATRQEVCRFPNTKPASLAFSPSGRLLASGSTDFSVLLWDLTGHMHNGKMRAAKLTREELQGPWDDLSGSDVARARRSLWTLVATGEDTIAFLRTRLHPAVNSVNAEAIVRLIADLDSAQFEVRSKAKAQLAELAELAEPALLEAQKNQPSLEQRLRIEELLQKIVDQRSRPSGDRLRTLRAIEILEQIASPTARQVLQTLSRGAAGALMTREAQAALARLERHPTASQPSR